MIQIFPYPSLAQSIRLPNPELGDREHRKSTIQIQRAMSGKRYTNINKRGVNEVYYWEFYLTRYKALELYAFIQLYSGSKWKIIRGSQTIIANIKINPLTLSMTQHSVIADSVESIAVTLELESE